MNIKITVITEKFGDFHSSIFSVTKEEYIEIEKKINSGKIASLKLTYESSTGARYTYIPKQVLQQSIVIFDVT